MGIGKLFRIIPAPTTMNRGNFIKLSTAFGVAALCPSIISFTRTNMLPSEELIGKGNPQLFGDGFLLRKEAYDAFLKMKTEALKSGIKIKVVSSYRNYAHQNRIWERKYKKFTSDGLTPIDAIKKIVKYSTIPGTSRHHWGTDLDIVDGNVNQPKSLLLASHFHNNGPFCKLKEWLDEHSESFGFYLVYTDNGNRKGFKYEPWHLSYKPLSLKYLKEYKELNTFKMLQEEKLMGSEHFADDFIKSYISHNILDINPELLP